MGDGEGEVTSLSPRRAAVTTRGWQDHRVLTGLLGAFAAAVLYGAATVLQAAGVRSLRLVPAGAPLPARLWAGRLYAVGLALDGLGFLASIAALRTLPLFVVQSAIASSVAVTARAGGGCSSAPGWSGGRSSRSLWSGWGCSPSR